MGLCGHCTHLFTCELEDIRVYPSKRVLHHFLFEDLNGTGERLESAKEISLDLTTIDPDFCLRSLHKRWNSIADILGISVLEQCHATPLWVAQSSGPKILQPSLTGSAKTDPRMKVVVGKVVEGKLAKRIRLCRRCLTMTLGRRGKSHCPNAKEQQSLRRLE